MKKVLFIYRETWPATLDPFLKHIKDLLNCSVAMVAIQGVMAGNNEFAGRFAWDAFQKSGMDCLIVGEGIDLPKENDHLVLTDKTSWKKLIEKIRPELIEEGK